MISPLWNNLVEAILELWAIREFTELHTTLLEQEAAGIAINLASTKSRNQLNN